MRKTRRFAICCAVLSAAAIFFVPSCRDTGELMKIYGYTEIQPPSTLLSPGTMVTITSLPGEPFQLKVLCGPRASLGKDFQPRQSETVTQSLEKMRGQTFDLSPALMEKIHASAKFKAVRKIKATLQNPVLLELDDNDVLENICNRSASCRTAIKLRINRGYPVTMVSSALAGDVIFETSFDASTQLSAEQRSEIMRELAIELQAGSSYFSETKISARNLVFGIRDDAYLASLTLTDIDEVTFEETPPHRGTRILNGTAFDLNPQPDAPLVKPPPGPTGRIGPEPIPLPGGRELEGVQPSVEARPKNHPSNVNRGERKVEPTGDFSED
jgi:hypothetical protein